MPPAAVMSVDMSVFLPRGAAACSAVRIPGVGVVQIRGPGGWWRLPDGGQAVWLGHCWGYRASNGCSDGVQAQAAPRSLRRPSRSSIVCSTE